LTPGGTLKITFWSAEPNDLRGVVFVLKQYELAPSVPEAEWIAYLDRKDSDEQREQKERQAEAQKNADASSLHWAECRKHVEKSGCEDVKDYDERFCAAHESDASCGEFRKSAEEERLRKRFEACKPNPNDPACAEFHEALRTDSSHGPPPAPLAEEQPPKPSVNADWVPGGWRWDGWDFKWTGGGWRVPESDIRARLTVTAPSAPPAPRVEVAVAQPLVGAIWVPGAWHWNGAGWMWIGGGWRMPPQSGLRWRPPSWVVSSRGVQLDPGRWVR
jgi:hypothetical protein